jgi:hypothetical protein
MSSTKSRVHHYVPRWYQKRFLPPDKETLFYLNLKPETVNQGKIRFTRKDLWFWPPSRCFCVDDLYSMRFGKVITDIVEKQFFGSVDKLGAPAAEFFDSYEGFKDGMNEAFRALIMYMGAQRFRTPRGLDWTKRYLGTKDQAGTLIAMRSLFEIYGTMWLEGIWEFAKARKSSTKFIISDEPITFFNRRIFPSEEAYPGGEDLSKVGTRTLFPLGPETCIIITHMQLVRDPHVNPTNIRINARAFQQSIAKLTDLQFGRELEEEEVLRINYILKRRATRYIASGNREWLFPEKHLGNISWAKLDGDWFLFPHLWKIPFTSEITMGFNDGSAWGMDEYGRMPGNPHYRDKSQHDKDWLSFQNAKREWARNRVGKAVAHVDNNMKEDLVGDSIMAKYLQKEGLIPTE